MAHTKKKKKMIIKRKWDKRFFAPKKMHVNDYASLVRSIIRARNAKFSEPYKNDIGAIQEKSEIIEHANFADHVIKGIRDGKIDPKTGDVIQLLNEQQSKYEYNGGRKPGLSDGAIYDRSKKLWTYISVKGDLTSQISKKYTIEINCEYKENIDKTRENWRTDRKNFEIDYMKEFPYDIKLGYKLTHIRKQYVISSYLNGEPVENSKLIHLNSSIEDTKLITEDLIENMTPKEIQIFNLGMMNKAPKGEGPLGSPLEKFDGQEIYYIVFSILILLIVLIVNTTIKKYLFKKKW